MKKTIFLLISLMVLSAQAMVGPCNYIPTGPPRTGKEFIADAIVREIKESLRPGLPYSYQESIRKNPTLKYKAAKQWLQQWTNRTIGIPFAVFLTKSVFPVFSYTKAFTSFWPWQSKSNEISTRIDNNDFGSSRCSSSCLK